MENIRGRIWDIVAHAQQEMTGGRDARVVRMTVNDLMSSGLIVDDEDPDAGEPTNSVSVCSWSDPPEDGRDADEWPYPTEYEKYLITGDLAYKIRRRVRTLSLASVYIIEEVISGGYSEYTQENSYNFELQVGGSTIDLGSDGYNIDNGLTLLVKWLEKSE